MNIKTLFVYKKNVHSVFGSVSLPDGTMTQNSLAATAIVILIQERDVMQWQKIWPAARRENGFLEVWPVGLILFIFTNGGCTCFSEKKNYPTRNASQSQDGGFLEDLLAVCPETWVALDTANLVTFF